MDIASLIGVIVGFACVIISIIWGGANIMLFFDIPSIFIVCGGTFSSVLVSYTVGDLIKLIAITKNAFLHKPISTTEVIAQIVDFALIARRQGILMLEDKLENIDDDFFKKGFRLAIDGTAPESIKNILMTDLSYSEERHKFGRDMFNTIGTYGPAFGMIGTLVGLVIMLKNMSSPDTIGPAMAVALITTFYGALIANVVAMPLAAKLKLRADQETISRKLIIEGILSIQSGDNPRLVEEKLKAYLSPYMRARLEKKG